MRSLHDYPLPLVAILRGLTPAEAPAIGGVLFDTGFRLLEVPLNWPEALRAMQALMRNAPDDALVGAGTVLSEDDVDAVKDAGGQFIVAPNCEPDVIARAVKKDMLAMPGVTTPTEAFRALSAGAHGLKLFPAQMVPPEVVKSLRSVLPAKTHLLPVGGIQPHNMALYVEAGASGFGIGGQLYRPGMNPIAVQRAAESFMAARQAILQGG